MTLHQRCHSRQWQPHMKHFVLNKMQILVLNVYEHIRVHYQGEGLKISSANCPSWNTPPTFTREPGVKWNCSWVLEVTYGNTHGQQVVTNDHKNWICFWREQVKSLAVSTTRSTYYFGIQLKVETNPLRTQGTAKRFLVQFIVVK